MRSAQIRNADLFSMPRDIDNQHDLTDPDVFRERMRQEDQESKAPCGRCDLVCVDPVRCEPYKHWRKRYLAKRYG